MHVVLYLAAAVLIAAGLVGSIVPALPGIPLVFGGLWICAYADGFRHVGRWWMLGIALVGAAGLTFELIAGALGAQRVGASPRAMWGALLGTVIGLFFGLPGLIVGPFAGAVIGELSAGRDPLTSTRAGLGAWLGFIVGSVLKLATALSMLTLWALAWWINRG